MYLLLQLYTQLLKIELNIGLAKHQSERYNGGLLYYMFRNIKFIIHPLSIITVFKRQCLNSRARLKKN